MKAAIYSNRWLMLIIGVSVVSRLAVSVLMGNTVEALPGIYDQNSYTTLATRLLAGYGFTFDTNWWPATHANEPTAHWSYLYTFLVTLTYAFFGANPLIARILQSVLVGILLPLLTWRITRRLTTANSVLPLLAAAWAALYGYFIYYAAALMTESLYIVAILWTFDCALRIAQQEPARRQHNSVLPYIELGLGVAITVMLRQVYLVFVPFLLLWLWYQRVEKPITWSSAANTALKIAVTVGVVIVTIAPITLWNYKQFNRFVLLNTNSGYAFFWSNHPIHGVSFVPIFTADMPSYYELIPEELRPLDEAALDQALMQRGVAFVLADPSRYLQLSRSRIPHYFMFWTSSDSSLMSNIVRVASFGITLPFVILGIALWVIRLRKRAKPDDDSLGLSHSYAFLLLLFVLVYTGVHVASWVGIRYRLPVDAVLVIFAAYGLQWVLVRTPIWKRIRSVLGY